MNVVSDFSGRSAAGGAGAGACVGILMLDTRFPRVVGDIGNADTWDFPVRYRVVEGVFAEAVVGGMGGLVLDDGIAEIGEKFIAAGRELVEEGACGITTSCGFLSVLQEPLRRALAVPVATSSLLQIPLLNGLLPAGKRVGVVTLQRARLGEAHLRAAGAPLDTPIVGTENGREFSRVILNDETRLDVARCEEDLVEAGGELLRRYADVGAILLECANMPPYAAAMGAALGVPIYSFYTFVQWFQGGLQPRGFL